MKHLIAAAAILLSTTAYAQQAKFLVCPAHLSYCYYEKKPIYQEKQADDVIAESNARLRAAREADEAQARSISRGLDYELNRSFMLRR